MGQQARQGLEQMFREMGTDCEAGGETRRALIDDGDLETTFKFLEEFAVANDDVIRNCITEDRFSVVDYKPVSKFGVFWVFRVTTVRILPDEPVRDDTPAPDLEET